MFEKIKVYELVMGLTTKDGIVLSVEDTKDRLFLILNDIVPGATVSQGDGYYTHDNGVKVFESSIKIELLFVEEETIMKLANILCKEFEQESIAIMYYEKNSMLFYGDKKVV
jgi:hypothetical protein